MNTPICDFVRDYIKSDAVRFHMPGHKGRAVLGFEALDITEFDGADNLFSPSGIIEESEKNASEIFGAHTFYSTGGSTLAIQAMLRLFTVYAKKENKPLTVLAGRNAHKAFINAAALLGIKVSWIFGESNTYYSSVITPEDVEEALSLEKEKPSCVYVTSPDYLGNMLDIKNISKVCKKHGVLLLVDNAHGAYLKLLGGLHPIELGADMCCDSAHKTLPVLTGGAYLHIGKNAPSLLSENAKSALSLFSTSSPSYLILQSLDAVNPLLEGCGEKLSKFAGEVAKLKNSLLSFGYTLTGSEPLKITLAPKSLGYTGDGLSEILKARGIYSEFHDSDFLVLMATPFNGEMDLKLLSDALLNIKKLSPITKAPPAPSKLTSSLTLQEALFSESEKLPIELCVGKICAETAVSCPPCVPIAVFGEVIDKNAAECFKYYGIKECAVIKEVFS